MRDLTARRAERSQRRESYLLGRRDSTTLFGLLWWSVFSGGIEGFFSEVIIAPRVSKRVIRKPSKARKSLVIPLARLAERSSAVFE